MLLPCRLDATRAVVGGVVDADEAASRPGAGSSPFSAVSSSGVSPCRHQTVGLQPTVQTRRRMGTRGKEAQHQTGRPV
jgi:hypothetical protein